MSTSFMECGVADDGSVNNEGMRLRTLPLELEGGRCYSSSARP